MGAPHPTTITLEAPAEHVLRQASGAAAMSPVHQVRKQDTIQITQMTVG